ncbi:Cell surface glycoprotein [Wickerhamomyces ciferrii]|uniref:Cell surface glycoprotein n=1 Tax=Wickerhamomyces ciferrii (strain ATCC 14091 / BCRC 22168 / CBS 111 / JCM 3599 / NBRC 0793 / NRRL Y-1031 F-60-10) TaxID=1206466 RepID=K0KXY0_WICCF|nr:Cell surface glycoprotein [Wickerhamomyces ciferrii]CCH46927.1 Cell surface glycoprotein [Wickerhamomyces ciferrii]
MEEITSCQLYFDTRIASGFNQESLFCYSVSIGIVLGLVYGSIAPCLAAAAMMLNHYTFIGVKENATQDEIKKAYKKLALKHHPDKSKAPESDEIFKKLVEVYDVLTNPQKKKEYDLSLTQLMSVAPQFKRQGPSPGPGPRSYPPPPPPPNTFTHTESHQYGGYTRGPYNHNAQYNFPHQRHGGPAFPAPPPSASNSRNFNTSGSVPRQPPSANNNKFTHDDDDFDFAYRRNQQTHYDSFSNNKTYFTSSKTSYNSTNGASPGYVRNGSTFNKAGHNNNNNNNNSNNNTGGKFFKKRNQPNYTTSHTQYSPDGNIPPHNVRVPNNGAPPSRFHPSNLPPNPMRPFIPPPFIPPHANGPSPQQPPSANSSFRYTQGSTSVPSVPVDPLPNSWQKQKTNFKTSYVPSSSSPGGNIHQNSHHPSPPQSNANTSSKSQRQQQQQQQPPQPPPQSDIPIYPTNMEKPPTKDNPGPNSGPNPISDLTSSASSNSIPKKPPRTTLSINELFENMSNPSKNQSTPLKFEFDNIDISTKSTPRNIRTQNKYVNRNERSGIPSNSRSPSLSNGTNSGSNTPKFQTASGRPPRTSLEESNKFEYRFEETREDEGNFEDEESEDELVEIDESTFRSNGPPNFKKQKTQSNSPSPPPAEPPSRNRPNSSASSTGGGINSMNFDDFKKTTPLTQTNGNFEMKGFTRALEESNEDLNEGKKLKKQRNSNVPRLENEMLGIEEFQLYKLPEPSNIIKDLNDWQRYRREFDEFQTRAIKLKGFLSRYLDLRVNKDQEFTNFIFKSSFNMDLYDYGLQKDNAVAVHLVELNQSITRVMREYQDLKSRFPKH